MASVRDIRFIADQSDTERGIEMARDHRVADGVGVARGMLPVRPMASKEPPRRSMKEAESRHGPAAAARFCGSIPNGSCLARMSLQIWRHSESPHAADRGSSSSVTVDGSIAVRGDQSGSEDRGAVVAARIGR